MNMLLESGAAVDVVDKKKGKMLYVMQPKLQMLMPG